MTLAERECLAGCTKGTFYDFPHPNQLCSTCGGTGALVPGLRIACGCRTVMYFDCHCEKRYWMLIPQAEQMGVLVRAAKNTQLDWTGVDWMAFVPRAPRNEIIADTPEEALAQAILLTLKTA